MKDDSSSSDRWPAAAEELRLINSVVSRISQVREVNHIMNIVLSELMKVTDADQGVISIVAKYGEDELMTVVRNKTSSSRDLPFQISQSLAGWVLANRQMLCIDDLDHDARFQDLDSDNGKYKSAVCCPLVVRDDAIGIIAMIRAANKGPFNPDNCRLVGILAAQSAAILANAQLMSQLAQQNALLEKSQGQLREENAQLRSQIGASYTFENIIGTSAAIRQALILASKYSANDSPVLITGETGTGKELVARAIHANSRRRNYPLVIKNCSIKTESLLESELFGHTRGAFTGAVRDKPGLFKEAQHGTVFLDEIGDAPLSTQAAILRVIQSGEIRPVGSSKTELVDVRVLSATNRNLKEEIINGAFREDLYYRLNTLSLTMPTLRDRREDIPLLIQHFLASARLKGNAMDLTISSEALDALQRFSWPGNIRQLENEIERASVLCNPDTVIQMYHLSPDILDSINEFPGLGAPHGRLRIAVEQLERSVIITTLAENDGNIMRSAEALGLTRKGLKDKMTRYGLKMTNE